MTFARALSVLPAAEAHNREKLRAKAVHHVMLKMPNLMHDAGPDDQLEDQWLQFSENNAKSAFEITRQYMSLYMDKRDRSDQRET